MPTYRKRIEAGSNFNKGQRSQYPYNEVQVNYTKRTGETVRVKVDSYNPYKGEIVERKFTQLGEVKEQTAKKYINQLANKYPLGAEIADVPSNRQLRGRVLEGQQILEVPPQKSDVPQSIKDYASDKGILIRDSHGRVYNDSTQHRN